MGAYEQQIAANAKAIQDIYNESKTIQQLDLLVGNLQLNDTLATYVNAQGKTVRCTFQDLLNLVSLTFYSQEVGNKIPFIITENTYEINIQQRPEVVYLYKAGVWQIEHEDFDFTYNNATGKITLSIEAVINDFFELVWFGSRFSKITIIADIENQIEFNYVGNYVNIDVYVNGSRMIEHIEEPDYTRTYFSINNKVTLTTPVKIGTIIEIVPY